MQYIPGMIPCNQHTSTRRKGIQTMCQHNKNHLYGCHGVNEQDVSF